MSNRHSIGARDKNEPFIVEIIKRFHVPYLALSEGQGADLLILTNPVEFWEVKNPSRPPSQRKLTETEKAMKEICKDRGIIYRVVEYSDQAADILTAHFERGGK